MITEVYDLLYRLGITANYKGFFQTSTAVLLSAQNMDCLLMVTKWLYPEVAKRYSTAPACVERNIRTVVAMAWSYNPGLLTRLARCQMTVKPTASKFISILASALVNEATRTVRRL